MFETRLLLSPTVTILPLSVSQCLWTCHSISGCLAVSFAYSGQQCLIHTSNQYIPGVTIDPQSGWDYFELHCSKHFCMLFVTSNITFGYCKSLVA